MNERTALYRHFDADGQLLYVGISLSAVGRLSQHRTSAGWYGQIAKVEIQWFDSRSVAAEAERKAIREESPKYNIAGRTEFTAADLMNDPGLDGRLEPSCLGSLVGRCFVVFGDNRKVERQGIVRGAVGQGLFLVQWFEWAMGELSTLNVVPVTDMAGLGKREKGTWEFFEDDEHMREWIRQRA